MNILDINKTRQFLISHWFYKIKNNFTNTEILLLNFKNKDEAKEFFESDFTKNNKNLLVTSLQKLSKKDLNSMNKRSIILVASKEISFGHLGVLKDENIKILFCEITHLKQLENYISSSNYHQQKPMILSQDSHYFYLQNLDPSAIVYNVNYAKYFISTFLDYEEDNDLSFNQQSIKLFLLRNVHGITIDTILNDIKYFEFTGVLTSRLAIFIFKMCTFYYDATDKEIGTFYADILGTSRVYNNRRFSISNTKGYLVQDVQQRTEYNIKVEIASYLVNHNACDKNILSQATGLTLNDLENLIER